MNTVNTEIVYEVKGGRVTLNAEQVSQLIEIPTDKWAGSCHAISMAVAPLVGGVVRRGYFTGTVDPDSYFGRMGRFVQHSWVELPDGRVLDPTRHAFAGGEPVLWTGPADDYDIGGCKSQPPAGSPPPQTGDPEVVLRLNSLHYFNDLLGGEAEAWFPDDGEGGGELLLDIRQAIWLANLPVKDREGSGVLSRFFAAEAYEALVLAGQRGLIPIDRLDWILPE